MCKFERLLDFVGRVRLKEVLISPVHDTIDMNMDGYLLIPLKQVWPLAQQVLARLDDSDLTFPHAPTRLLIILNPNHGRSFTIRRRLLPQISNKYDELKDELQWLTAVQKCHIKSSLGWTYRFLITSQPNASASFHQDLVDFDFQLLNELVAAKSRAYGIWTYRLKLMKHAPFRLDSELKWVTSQLQTNPSNYSLMNYAFQIMLIADKRDEWTRLSLLLVANLKFYPGHESQWMLCRMMVRYLSSEDRYHDISEDLIVRCTRMNDEVNEEHVLKFERAIKRVR